MKLKADRATLLKALAHIQSVAEKRNTIPILANVLIAVKGGRLTLTATDMEIAIVEEIAANASREGSTTAPASVLFEIVRKLPDGADVELDQAGGDAPLALRAGRYATSLNVLAVDDFPSMTAGNLPHRFRIPAVVLRGLIDRSRFAISTEETRYYLNGIYLHPGQGRRRRDAARGRHRRAPAGARRDRAAGGRFRHAGRDRAAQDHRRGAQAAGRGGRGRGDRAVGHAHPVHHRHGDADQQADRRHLPRIRARDPARQRQDPSCRQARLRRRGGARVGDQPGTLASGEAVARSATC